MKIALDPSMFRRIPLTNSKRAIEITGSTCQSTGVADMTRRTRRHRFTRHRFTRGG